MSKHFRPWKIDDIQLLPPSVQDYVGKGHLARLIVALVRESLDLSEIAGSYRSGLGQPPFDPWMMTALLLHGYDRRAALSRALYAGGKVLFCSPPRLPDTWRLTELSNVVAYACRPWSTKDRHDVHRHRRLNRRGAIGGHRRYDAHGRPAARPWPRNERRKGRKGRKPRILRKYGPCRRCRDAAETGGNWRKLACAPLAGH
jgi:hypothetical protein